MAAQSIALNPRFSRATPVDSEWRVPEHVGSRFPEVAEPGLVDRDSQAHGLPLLIEFQFIAHLGILQRAIKDSRGRSARNE
jgi:hypothetical protein